MIDREKLQDELLNYNINVYLTVYQNNNFVKHGLQILQNGLELIIGTEEDIIYYYHISNVGDAILDKTYFYRTYTECLGAVLSWYYDETGIDLEIKKLQNTIKEFSIPVTCLKEYEKEHYVFKGLLINKKESSLLIDTNNGTIFYLHKNNNQLFTYKTIFYYTKQECLSNVLRWYYE